MSWRDSLAANVVRDRHAVRRQRITRDQALQRLEWQFEELLVRDKKRITREHLMILMSNLPIPMADALVLWQTGTHVNRLLDKCFELLGETWQHVHPRVEEAS